MDRIVRRKLALLMIVFMSMLSIGACSSEDSPQVDQTIGVEESSNTGEVTHELTDPLLLVTSYYPPYIMAEGEDKGFAYDLVVEVFNRRGIDVTIEYYPWTRAVEMVRTNKAFATFPWIKNSQRLREYNFSNNICSENIGVVYLKDNPKIKEEYTEIEELKKYNVGAINEYFYVEELEALGFNLDATNTEEEAITKLYNGRYDVVILGETAIDSIINKLYKNEKDVFAVMEKPYRVVYEALRVSKDYPDQSYYLQEFNLGLKEVIEDGTYSDFMKKYGIEDIDVNSILDQYLREKLIIGLEDYAPFEYINLEGELSGIGYELMLEALCRMGYSESNYEFVVYPWSRLMELGRNGGVDVILDAFYSEERQEHFSYSDEVYMQSDYYFIALEHNNISYDGHVFSKPIETIGIVRDYEYGEAIMARLSDYQELIDEVGTTDELIEGLLNGRYDVVLGGESFSKFYMKEHKRNENLSFLWQPLNSLKSYIMYPLEKEHDALEQAVDEKMKTFRDDGTYDKILKFYLE